VVPEVERPGVVAQLVAEALERARPVGEAVRRGELPEGAGLAAERLEREQERPAELRAPSPEAEFAAWLPAWVCFGAVAVRRRERGEPIERARAALAVALPALGRSEDAAALHPDAERASRPLAA
jgi:hypothetical protein